MSGPCLQPPTCIKLPVVHSHPFGQVEHTASQPVGQLGELAHVVCSKCTGRQGVQQFKTHWPASMLSSGWSHQSPTC